jgi:ankyrin repeat protein
MIKLNHGSLKKKRIIQVWIYNKALHRAAFLDLTMVVSLMFDEMKRRLGIEARDEIRNWINSQSEQGYTAIHYAAYRGNIDVINKLIDNGAIVEICNKRGLNVLHMAAQGNQPSSLVYFKEKYSLDIHSVDDMGSTPLHWACYTGSENSVLFLLCWNPKLNAQDREGLTPLHLAVMSERTKIIKKLLQKGANPDLTDLKGRTPYDLAFDKNKTTIVNMLKRKDNCKFCNFHAPLGRLERTKINVLYFFILQGITSILVYFTVIPCIVI